MTDNLSSGLAVIVFKNSDGEIIDEEKIKQSKSPSLVIQSILQIFLTFYASPSFLTYFPDADRTATYYLSFAAYCGRSWFTSA